MSVSATYLTNMAMPAVGRCALEPLGTFPSSVPATVLMLLTLLPLCMCLSLAEGLAKLSSGFKQLYGTGS